MRIRDDYENLKKYTNIITDYYNILSYYPDYYRDKVYYENYKFPYQDFEECIDYFDNNYKKSDLYKMLVKTGMDENKIYEGMKQNMLRKRDILKILFDESKKSCIDLCDLIDYIGHYPTTYPVPKEEEKNPEMEKLMEEYDIIIRYHMGDDLDELQVISDDIVRIIETLKDREKKFKTIEEKKFKNKDWMFKRTKEETSINLLQETIEMIRYFPESSYQKRGESRREEGKRYLRIQHGKNII